VRYQDEDLFDSQTTYRLGVSRILGDGNTVLWTNYGTGYRVPTFNELYFPFMGNPGLVPEESNSYEVGLWDKVGKNEDVELVYFHNDFENLIQWREVAPWVWQPVNVANATTQGLEFSFNQQLSDNWSHSLGFTRLSIWTDGDPLLRRPKYSGSYQLAHADGRDSFSLAACYTGRRFDAKTFPGPDVVGGYLVVDVAASRKLGSGTTLWLRINNLLDKEYEAAANYPSPGWNWLVGLSREL